MTFLQLLQITAAVLLIVSVLLQGGGAGLSSPLTGGGESFRTRRGVERILLYLAVFAATLFVGTVVASLVI